MLTARQPLRVGDAKSFRLHAARALRGKRKPRRTPTPRVPRLLEQVYAKHLRRALALLVELIKRRVLPEIPMILSRAHADLRADAAELERFDEFDTALASTINGVKIQYLTRIKPEVAATARATGLAVSKAQERDHLRAVETVVGIRPEVSEPWLNSVIDNFTSTNVRLIEGLSTSMLDKVSARIGSGVRQGLRAEAIAEQIRSDIQLDGGSISEKRANGIARDQVGSLYGELAQVRQKKLGIKKYRWSTSRDERVRPEHVEREGEIFDWSPIEPQLQEKGLTVPDDANHPGLERGCRCVGIAVFDDLLDEPPPDEG